MASAEASVPDASETSPAPERDDHRFGERPALWSEGVILPSHRDGQALANDVTDFYDAWKARYVVSGCADDQARIKSKPATDAFTVSEAHGYGMLIVAAMAGFDPEAQSTFDDLLRYAKAHPSSINNDLMAWAQDANCRNVGGADAATDGDLDIAYALLLAHSQWGSAGEIDYLNEAKRVASAVFTAGIHPEGTVLLGDWARYDDERFTATRLSDFMPGHFRAFMKYDATERWAKVLDAGYGVVDTLQNDFAPITGLLPDFALHATSEPRPAPPNWLEGDHDGEYSWNACRTPLRLAIDYLTSGEMRARDAVRRMNAWIQGATEGDPSKIRAGYALNGRPTADYGSLAFTAPFLVSAMVEPDSGSNQAWLNALWEAVVGEAPSEYYGDSIKMIALLMASGNWWTP